MAWLSSFPPIYLYTLVKLEERGLHHGGSSSSGQQATISNATVMVTVICRPDQQPSSPADVVSWCARQPA